MVGFGVVPCTKWSAAGPITGGVGCSGRLNLLFASAIGEPHELFDQVPNLFRCLAVALLGWLHLDDGESFTGSRGVALALINRGAENGQLVLGEGFGHFAA